MQTATLISYSFKEKTSRKDKEKFRRAFLGYKDKSNHGAYQYHRPGILTNLQHIKPTKSLIIVNNKDKKKIDEVFNQFNVEYLSWEVLLNKSDYKILNT